MANTYISELSTGVAAGSNYLVQDDGSTTSKVTVSDAVASASIIGSTPMGTTATTLTGAIAEHEGDISTLTSKTDGLSTYYYDVNGEATSAGSVHDYDFSISKTGYTPIGVVGSIISAGGQSVPIHFYIMANGTTARIRVLNAGSSSNTPGYVRVYILYKKN